jgi:hypothetical protein
MRDSFEFDCVYGSQCTKDIGYYYNGWYVVDGGVNVNFTHDVIDISETTNVEELNDQDTMTSIYPIYSLEELVRFIDDDEDGSNEEEGEDVVMTEEECNYFSGLLYGVDNNQ